LADVVFGCGGCKLLAAESVLCIGDKIASFLAVTMRKAIRESSVNYHCYFSLLLFLHSAILLNNSSHGWQ